MILDSSVVVAMLGQEPEANAIIRILSDQNEIGISAGNYIETGVVLQRKGGSGASSRLDPLLENFSVQIEPVTARQAKIGRQAFHDFGQGSGHAAKLNFGDCFAYALARDTGRPLLYKGDDFAHAGFERLV